jgi:hypothetical protein
MRSAAWGPMHDFVVTLTNGEINWLESKSSSVTPGDKARAARLLIDHFLAHNVQYRVIYRE